MSKSIPSNSSLRHFSLSGNGDGDYNKNLRLGDTGSGPSIRGIGLTNQESGTPSYGKEYFGQTQSKRNDTSASLRGSPQLNLGSGNGDFSHGGHFPHVSRALPKNYGIDPSYATPYTGTQKYGRDRDRMKDELANSNAMAINGNGILPGGVACDRRTSGPFLQPSSFLKNRITRSDINSSIPRPEMYSPSSTTSLSGTNSAPTLNNTSNNNGGRIRMNENNNNSRVSSLISQAQKANEVLRSQINDSSSVFQDRLNSYTRPTPSWNNVGTGGRRECLPDQEIENVGSGYKRQKQELYRSSLERQIKQDSKIKAEEERKFNVHPFGPSYESSKPSWQSSTKITNRPEDIPILKRNLAQNSSTRISQYEVPQHLVAQAKANLQNSRISPDSRGFQQQTSPNNPSRNSQQHQFNSNSISGVSANNNNFRDATHSNSSFHPAMASAGGGGYNEDIPQQQQMRSAAAVAVEQNMHPGMDIHNFHNSIRSSPTPLQPQVPYQERHHFPSNNGYPQADVDRRGPAISLQPPGQPRPVPPFYSSPQVQSSYGNYENEMSPPPVQSQPGQPQPSSSYPSPLPPPHPMQSAPAGYPYPPAPAAYLPQYPPQYPPQVPYPTSFYPFQPPVPVGYPPAGPMMMMMDPYGNPVPQGGGMLPPGPYPSYDNRGPGRRYNVDDDELIQQRAAEFARQMHTEHSGNKLKPSKSMFENLERLRVFVEEKLTEKNLDYDELRESIFGRPNNLRSSDSDIDYKPIKDMINRAELAEQIEINKRKKAIEAAKEQAEEEKIERKLQEFYGLQKQREKEAEAHKEEINRVHITNKKAVSKHFLAEENNKQQQGPRITKKLISPRKVIIVESPQPFRENPEQSLARKIRNPINKGQPFSGGGDQNNNGGGWEQNINGKWEQFNQNGRGDYTNNQPNNHQAEAQDEYSYAKYMKQFSNRPASPPLPALVPKSNEETLRGKLTNKTFSRPRLSPSILHLGNINGSTNMRTQVEHGLRKKISN